MVILSVVHLFIRRLRPPLLADASLFTPHMRSLDSFTVFVGDVVVYAVVTLDVVIVHVAMHNVPVQVHIFVPVVDVNVGDVDIGARPLPPSAALVPTVVNHAVGTPVHVVVEP